MKKTAFCVIVIFCWMGCAPVQNKENATADKNTYFIDKIIDGDTFIIEGGEHVRLIGIDAPETRNSYKQRNFYFGEESKKYLNDLLKDRNVTLEFDKEKKDRYHRLLAYAWLDDSIMVNAILVEKGFARAKTYPPNVKYTKWFNQLEREAKQNHRGLWNK